MSERAIRFGDSGSARADILDPGLSLAPVGSDRAKIAGVAASGARR